MTELPLIEVKEVTKEFRMGKESLKAVGNISLNIFPRETLGLVGESGCGKTTLGRMLIRLHKPTSGDILFGGQSLLSLPSSKVRELAREMQYIFQDPFASLNPRMTVAEILAEPLKIHCRKLGPKGWKKRVDELLDLVGLHSGHSRRFPHEFSGGQRQRICIARSLALNPRFIVCDEPIAALDVSIQAQIVNLLKKLQREIGLTYLFISHDLSMVKYIAHRIAVMYLGLLMEPAPSHTLYETALHPYTQALLSTIPLPDPRPEAKKTRIVLKGELPSLLTPPKGCVFCTRCPRAMPICFDKRPPLRPIKPNHTVACHLYESRSS